MDKKTLNKYTKTHLPSALMPLRKKVITLLGCFKFLSQKNKFTIPKELKAQIISYDPLLIYSPQLLNEIVPFLTSSTLAKYCASLPYGVMKDYLTLYGNGSVIQDSIQREIDKRDNSHVTSTWKYRSRIIMQQEIDYRDTYYSDGMYYISPEQVKAFQEIEAWKELHVSKKSRKKHCCHIS